MFIVHDLSPNSSKRQYLVKNKHWLGYVYMVFNATFNIISVISWWSVLLVEKTGENHRPVASHWQILLHNVVSSTSRHDRDSNTQF